MNILVTGASRGIGKTICDELGKTHKIYTTARNEELLKYCENYCVCDLSSETDLLKLGNYITANRIDILINNAGEYINSAINAMCERAVNADIIYCLLV